MQTQCAAFHCSFPGMALILAEEPQGNPFRDARTQQLWQAFSFPGSTH